MARPAMLYGFLPHSGALNGNILPEGISDRGADPEGGGMDQPVKTPIVAQQAGRGSERMIAHSGPGSCPRDS